MEEKKRKHHYVYQAYLKAWANNKNKICCLRGEKIFSSDILNVAEQRDFYRTKWLNDSERNFLDLLYPKDMLPEEKKALDDHTNLYLQPLKMLENVQRLKKRIEKDFKRRQQKIPDDLASKLANLEKEADIGVNNAEENYLSEIEDDSIKWINSLNAGNTDFYYKTGNTDIFHDERFEFLFSVCTQYYRTKAIKQKWIASITPHFEDPKWGTLGIPKEEVSLENLTHHYFWFMKNILAYSLRRNNAPLTLLKNKTKIPFITSDQPVINIKADGKNAPTELILYYPISPCTAILINDFENEKLVELNEIQVKEYNAAIYNKSYELIFANSKELLEDLLNSNVS